MKTKTKWSNTIAFMTGFALASAIGFTSYREVKQELLWAQRDERVAHDEWYEEFYCDRSYEDLLEENVHEAIHSALVEECPKWAGRWD